MLPPIARKTPFMSDLTTTSAIAPNPTASRHWGAVICLSLLTFVLVASEFMPVSLLTPIAADLSVTEGHAGQAIAISGLFAVLTSLFGNSLLARIDRRRVVMLYTAILVISGLMVTFAPNYLVFMAGRALIGVSIGGFWSLSTAILARIVPGPDLPRAIALLQGGTALATVIAAPLGAWLGGLIGWRGAFAAVIPVGLLAMIWQAIVLPPMPATRAVSLRHMTGLLQRPVFALGMAATTLAFMGQFAIATYLRPYLEGVTGLQVNALSAFLLIIGVFGLIGTLLAGLVLRRHLALALIGMPAVLTLVALLMIVLGPVAWAVAVLLVFWGLFTTPIPVGWNTWMTRVIPNDLEAGGGLQVALIQFAITGGAFTGGVLFDSVGWWSPFALGAALMAGASLTAIATLRQTAA